MSIFFQTNFSPLFSINKSGSHLEIKPFMQINGGHEPSKEMLKKIRRRCVREMDYESDDKVEALARQFKIIMGAETRRNMLFELEYNMDSYM